MRGFACAFCFVSRLASPVTPLKNGVQRAASAALQNRYLKQFFSTQTCGKMNWIPACAGMTLSVFGSLNASRGVTIKP
ncbi:hypothetical protein MNBD_ALPHA12-1975 [hydrothermal vent metagenome]|uniref:Uncharacterized protein n=1 Tax=hydrothermal vent metagenome TaxID=652676 RepID=A0A3B0UFY2_9ZZZZ